MRTLTVEDMQVSPNTLDLIQVLRDGRYRRRPPLLRWLPSGPRRHKPLMGPSVAERIQARTESVEILCNGKLARIIKR